MCKLKSQEWTTAGEYSFTTPTGVTAGWLTMRGGGAGGFGSGIWDGEQYFPGGGGGSAQGCFNVLIPLSGTMTVIVGAGGAGLIGDATSVNTGTASSFGTYTVCPGGAGYIWLGPPSSIAGSCGGPHGVDDGTTEWGYILKDSTHYFSGSGGGYAYTIAGGLEVNGVAILDGQGAGGHLGGLSGPSPSDTTVGGGGGGSTVHGQGAEGGDPSDVNALNGYDSTIPGAGGGGGSLDATFDPDHLANTNGGDGCHGYVAIMWAA